MLNFLRPIDKWAGFLKLKNKSLTT